MANDIGRSAHCASFTATCFTHRPVACGAARTKRWRRGIALVATLAMLMHAGLLMRHNVVMLEVAHEHHSLIADLASLCRAGPSASRATPADLPAVPRPADTAACPVCAGLVAALAILDTQPAAARISYEPAIVWFGADRGSPAPARNIHPPARAPPARA